MTQTIPLVWTQSVVAASFWPPTHMTEHSGMCWQGCPCSLGIMRTHTCYSGLGMSTIKHVSVGYLSWAGQGHRTHCHQKQRLWYTHCHQTDVNVCVRGGQMIKKLVWAAYKTKRDCDLNLHQAAVVTLNVGIQREWASRAEKVLLYGSNTPFLTAWLGHRKMCVSHDRWQPTSYFSKKYIYLQTYIIVIK